MKKTVSLLLCILLTLLLLPAGAEETLRGYSAKEGYQYLLFGRYPTEKNGTEAPILWRVLRNENGQAYLLSEYILEARRIDQDRDHYAGWEYSEMFAYLNEAFLLNAFSDEERGVLLRHAEDNSFVTLLSSDELKDASLGFKENRDRNAQGTPYAREGGLDIMAPTSKGFSPWWTRTRSTDGAYMQRQVMEEGKLGRTSVNVKNRGMRPAVTLDTSRASVVSGAGTRDDPFVLALSDAPVPASTPTPAPESTQTAPSAAESGVPHTSESDFSVSPLFPPLTAEGFLPDGEEPFVLEDDRNGVWLYASQTLRIEIHRQADESKPLRWFEADIRCKPEADMFTTYAFDEAHYTNFNRLTSPQDIAKQHGLVFAMNTDFFIYRVERDREVSYNYPIGIVIRRGHLMYDVPKSLNATAYPPLDVLALYPDGDVKMYQNAETTGEKLVADGVSDALSFGPILVQDSAVTKRSSAYGEVDNPRTAFGFVEKGHYICVLLEGRMKNTYSKGSSCIWMANTMQRLGCVSAINLDGGQTAAMMFMGNRINKIGTYDGKTTDRDRPQNEVLGIGHFE